MIENLTREQEAQIPIFKQKWMDSITEPMQEEVAIQAINSVYASLGLPAPKIIIGESPRDCVRLRIEYEGK